jgi:hypothetical protein
MGINAQGLPFQYKKLISQIQLVILYIIKLLISIINIEDIYLFNV